VIFKEGVEINKSLFTLRQVIAALYESSTSSKISNDKVIPPYRDSKLTSLLKQSIGGNSYCVMIACINPTFNHFEESLQTLTYASMASYISNIPIKNIDPKIQ
jgi:kinesin family protein 4/21/27